MYRSRGYGLLIRAIPFLLLVLASCTRYHPAANGDRPSSSALDIVYASTDLRHIRVFSQDGALFGPPLVSMPGYPPDTTRYFEPSEGVQCISVGNVSGNTSEYAIKRPITAGDRYRCLATSFHVIRCFGENCRAAIVEREWPLSGPDYRGALRSYMYVNDCIGVLAFSETADMANAIPLDAELLRGAVGILPHRNYPNCTSF